MIRIDRLEALVYRYPLATPVQTSFGLMQDRPMVVVKLTGRDGVIAVSYTHLTLPTTRHG